MAIRPFLPALAMTLVLASAGSPGAFAQSATVRAPVAPEPEARQWGAGAGVNFKQKAYRDIDTDTTAIPLLTYENRWFRFAGPTVDLKLPSSSNTTFTLRARYAFEDGYESDDAPILAGMAERESSLWLGGGVLWRHDIASIAVEWLADASGHSEGQRIRLAAEKAYRAGDFLHTPRLALNWLDENYVDYYYGVAPSEARPGRPAYEGQATLSTELGLRSIYAFSSAHSVYLDVSSTWLGNEIKDSPLVDRSSERAVRFGYVYRFR